MRLDQYYICRWSKDVPVFLHGSRPVSPLNCMQCKNPILLEYASVSDELADATNKWEQIYKSLYIPYGSIVLKTGNEQNKNC